MINYQTIKNDLFTTFTALVPTGMPVIFYQPNSPRPIVAYISIFLNFSNMIGYDYTAPNAETNGNVYMKGDRQMTVQLQAYGNDPITVLENIRTGLQKQTILDILGAGGISFLTSFGINDITDLVDSQFEKRAQLDISLAIAQEYFDNPGFFDTIELTENIYSPDQTLIYNEMYTITAP